MITAHSLSSAHVSRLLIEGEIDWEPGYEVPRPPLGLLVLFDDISKHLHKMQIIRQAGLLFVHVLLGPSPNYR